jgi:hypothetical protein
MKMKHNQKLTFHLNTDELNDNEENQETKFDLFVQSRRVKQISSALDKIMFHAQNKESLQMMQDQEFVSELLDELLDDSLLVLDGVQLDGETMDMSMKLMSDIKRAIGVLQQVVDDKKSQLN